MSERSKGDVSSSSRVNNNANRIVKNPLLSASVTGLSYDDFPNKPLLLPAAPPVVHHAPPAQPANALIAGILKREPKTLVTVGQPSGIDESEALDEINLNASSSDDSVTAANASNNPYQSVADANANPLLEPPLAADSLLSQAASSFGALPSVASNVFSTFSKRIYAGTREADEAQPQLDIQPTYIQQAGQVHAAAVAPPPFYAAPPAHAGEAAPEPPKFYAPTEVPGLAAGTLPPPPPSAGQNTYRISARKKLYAPIPGLSEQQQQPVPAADPFQAPPYPPQPSAAGAATYEQPAPLPVQEERKSGGLFSLTNLVPSGVLQNISGLVQSATGRSNEPAAPPPQTAYNPADSVGYFEINTSSAAVPQPFANYFTPAAPSAAADYFAPSAAPPTVGGYFNPAAVAATPANFFTPATAASGPATPVQPSAAFAPQAFTQPGAVSQQPAVSQSQTVAQVPPSVAAAAPPPPAVVGAPPQAAVTAGPPPTAGVGASPQTAVAAAPPSGVGATPGVEAPPPVVATESKAATAVVPPPGAAGAPPQAALAAAPQTSAGAAPPPAAAGAPPQAAVAPPPQTSAGAPPPAAFAAPPQTSAGAAPAPTGAAAPPPAAGPAHSSYRLQKGTRLYKSPLTAQETAQAPTAFGQPTALAATPFAPYTAPAAIFNPFGGTEPKEVELFAAPTSSAAPAPSQEVPLFAAAAPPAAPATSLFTPQTSTGLYQPHEASAPAASLFAPAPSDKVQEAPLFSSSTEAKQELLTDTSNNLFTSQTQSAELNSTSNQSQEVTLFAPASTSAVSEVPLFPTSQSLPIFSQGPTATLFTPQLDVKPEPQQTNQQKESEQETSLVSAPAPPTVEADQPTASKVDEPSQETPKTPPTALFQELSAVPVFFPPIRTATTEAGEETPLFVPVPAAAGTAEAGQSVELYPPAATTTAESDSKNQEAIAETSAPQPIFNANSLFAQYTGHSTGGPVQEALEVAAPQPTTTTTDLFAPPAQAPAAVSHLPSVALTTQTTTTFFNPFAQTVTTPLPQDPLTPPIGFVEPSTQADGNSLFAAQTIEPVLPEAETAKPATVAAAAPPPPPPQAAANQDNASQANPFRRAAEPAPTSTAAAAPSALLSFFTPAGNGNDFNFFGTAQQAGQFPELPPLDNVAPPALAQEPPAGDTATPHSTQALGFERLISDSQQAAQQTQNSNEHFYQNSSVNTFSGYFGSPVEGSGPVAQPQTQPEPQQQQQSLTGCNSANFFDHFAAGGQGQEDQRIQNFFNNPPLQDQPAAPGELKYDIVHSGLPNKRFEQRSQTSVSNVVEPPSSACSEFSTAAPGSAANPTNNQHQADRQSDYLLQSHLGELPEELLQQLRMANDKNSSTVPTGEALVYTPVLPHWFYKRNVDGKFVWTPFSHYDSALLETSLNSEETDSSVIVPVEGGRYDVNIKERTKTPVYWEGKAIEVRRCSWFYKGVDGKYVPYAEQTAEALEMEYRHATETNEWHKKIPLANGEQVTMHGPNVIVHFMPPSPADTWGSSVQGTSRPLVVKRDLNDFKIQQGESQRVDHLLFMVHGIGSACDLKMRNVEEVVDDFRYIAQQLVQSHYKNSTDMGLVGRVEVLPIEWHGHLHSEELGIDEKLKSITLESIPRLRNFTNDTLLDVLFYTSPKYCQKIMNTVADALNETYLKYRMRHPEFNGGVSLAGHSLGSLILFDLLCHQEPLKESEEENKENPDQLPQKKGTESKNVQLPNNDAMMPKQVSYAMGIGPAGTGQPVINYTQLIFHPKKFFALGSPIGMFVTIRGIDKLGLDFRLPTCAGFYNIFHPFDPVAYRIEALVNPDMKGIRPVLIPHHKGRKRMHLELKETMTRVGADIKQRFMDTFKTTLDSVNFLATVTRVKKEAEETLEKEVNSSNSQIFHKQSEDTDDLSTATTSAHARNRTDSESTTASDPEFIELDFPLGKLNDSKRVDYVLQEAPLEFINEYIFALSSHVCYWGSEDTILFVMKEIYAGLGISTDSQVPQQTMTIERPSSRSSSVGPSLLPM
ncbi:proline-rich protein 36 isoform X2 [Drosophila mojavensis]|uniref:proline-rich protein 36 isoform X2 n=1 Tax=Drosophila mojavensis TaxID=7230 RepID=UPI001CD05C05|nr:proline-rich protein 36 isoform X2 [Drosophila mojavensis]